MALCVKDIINLQYYLRKHQYLMTAMQNHMSTIDKMKAKHFFLYTSVTHYHYRLLFIKKMYDLIYQNHKCIIRR